MAKPFAEKLDRLIYGGIALLSAGVGMEWGVSLACVVGGALVFLTGLMVEVALLFRKRAAS